MAPVISAADAKAARDAIDAASRTIEPLPGMANAIRDALKDAGALSGPGVEVARAAFAIAEAAMSARDHLLTAQAAVDRMERGLQ